jgi:hypothetical protein
MIGFCLRTSCPAQLLYAKGLPPLAMGWLGVPLRTTSGRGAAGVAVNFDRESQHLKPRWRTRPDLLVFDHRLAPGIATTCCSRRGATWPLTQQRCPKSFGHFSLKGNHSHTIGETVFANVLRQMSDSNSMPRLRCVEPPTRCVRPRSRARF